MWFPQMVNYQNLPKSFLKNRPLGPIPDLLVRRDLGNLFPLYSVHQPDFKTTLSAAMIEAMRRKSVDVGGNEETQQKSVG